MASERAHRYRTQFILGSVRVGKAELGSKQTCISCGAKFYDLGKRPAVCPKCATSFDPDEDTVKMRRMRTRPVDYDKPEDDEAPAKPAEAIEDGFEDEVEIAAELGAEPDAPDIIEDEDGNIITPEPAAKDIGVDFEDDDDTVIADDDDDDASVFLAVDDEDDEPIDGIAGPEDDEH